MISFEMSEEQELIRDTLREFANEAMRSIARDCDETAQIPQDFLDSVPPGFAFSTSKIFFFFPGIKNRTTII